MELGENIQTNSENDDGYLHIIDDYESEASDYAQPYSTITHHDGAPSQTPRGDPGGCKEKRTQFPVRNLQQKLM